MNQDVNIQNDPAVAIYPGEAPRETVDAGVFYGRKRSKTNPKMRPFVFANRGGIEIINLQKTVESLEHATSFVKENIRNNKGLVLFASSEPAAEAALLMLAKKYSAPFVTSRWVGGTITNFKIISGRIEHLKKMRADLASGALERYTKKERLMIEQEVKRLEVLMGGLENLTCEPDFLIVVNPVAQATAVREARRKNIPVVALANVDADPDMIDYLVPGNDKSKTSITWFLGNIDKAIEEGMALRALPKEEPAPTKE